MDLGTLDPIKLAQTLRQNSTKPPRQCEHIKPSGAFCGSPALRGRRYCYFHLTSIGRRLRAEKARAARRPGDPPVLELPPAEDANSIQIALMQVMDAIVYNQLDTKRAGLLLYALQTASANLRAGANFSPAQEATVASEYAAFEDDYQLPDNAAALTNGADDADEEDPEKISVEDIVTCVLRERRKLVAQEKAAAERIAQAAKQAPPSWKEEDEDDPPVDVEKDCACGGDPQLWLCAMCGPLAQRWENAAARGRQGERVARSQRLLLGTKLPQSETSQEVSEEVEEDEPAA